MRPDTHPSDRSLERSNELVVASVYDREIGASLERVWENVYDWAHLPYLHSEAFHSIEKLSSGDWGWHARIGLGGGESEIELELVTDREAGHYVSRTLTGAGAPSEIWTSLDPVADHRTAIRVEFCVRPLPEEALAQVGEGYVKLYSLLWDQDEGMMQTRESALAGERPGDAQATGPAVVSLGPLDALRRRLPLVVEFGGEPFRVIEIDGDLIAHATTCPHLLGPLDRAEVVDGEMACPWHGYRFDARSGRSCDGRGLKLASAPQVVIDVGSGDVELRAADRDAPGRN
jgi:nitrite reductase/ring-hydroxylating ferredoxin subunit